MGAIDASRLYLVRTSGGASLNGYARVVCNAGDIAISGGCWMYGNDNSLARLMSSAFIAGEDQMPIGWSCQHSPGYNNYDIMVYAMCLIVENP